MLNGINSLCCEGLGAGQFSVMFLASFAAESDNTSTQHLVSVVVLYRLYTVKTKSRAIKILQGHQVQGVFVSSN